MINYKILVVDDDPIIVKILEVILESKGYQVRLAANGSEAIEALDNEKFDLVITDLEMGDPDGIAVLRKAKELDPLITGVVITGNHDVSFAIEAIKAGVDDYVLKPFSLNEVLDCVRKSIDKLELNRKSAQKYAAVSSSKKHVHDMLLLMSQSVSVQGVCR